MPREYKPIKHYEKFINAMQEDGWTYREIGERLGYTRDQVKDCVKRQRRRMKKAIENEMPTKRRGRPRKKPMTSQKEMELEINTLRMENELLKNFLQSIGRR